MGTVRIAQVLIEIGGVLLALMGGFHVALGVADSWNPRQFTPLDDMVRERMGGTSVRFSRRMNMWRSWIGFNISHGLGVFSFGITYVLLAIYGISFVVAFKPIMLFGVIISLFYFLTSFRFWFYGPTVGTGVGFLCFLTALLLM